MWGHDWGRCKTQDLTPIIEDLHLLHAGLR